MNVSNVLKTSPGQLFSRTTGALLLIVCALAFVSLIPYTTQTRDRMANDEQVSIVTGKDLSTKILFGQLKKCDGKPCWMNGDFTEFKKAESITLPKYDFRKHADYQKALSEGKVTYLLDLKLPENLLDLDTTISFFPGYINLERYRIYHEGSMIHAGNGTSSEGAMAVITLPQRNRLKLVIEGDFNSSDMGILYKGDAYIGPSLKLSGLMTHKERSMVTFYLIWLLTMGTMLALFSALYIFTSKRDAYGEIIGFSALTMMSLLMKSDFLAAWLNLNRRLFFVLLLETSAAFFILRFVLKLNLAEKRPRLRLLWIAALGGWSFLAFAYSQGIGWVTIASLFHWLNLQFDVILAVCLVTSVTLARRNRDWSMAIALVVLFALKVHFTVRPNFVYAPLADLSILLYVAAAAILEFADNEKTLARQSEKLRSQARDVAIGKTAGLLAHDVRKPFSQMKIILDSFDDYQENLSGLHAARRDIGRSLAHVQTMVGEIMDFGREGNLQLRPYSLYNLLDFVIGQVGQHYPDTNIRIEYFLESTLMPKMDHERMARAISNIASNAVDAIVQHKVKDARLIFRSREENGMIVLDIINDGPHIPADVMERLFQPFFTSGKNNGTGLGLASAKQTLELHGGRIEAANVENGVMFSLYIPASSELEFSRDGFLPTTLSGLGEEMISNVEKLENALRSLKAFTGEIRLLLLEDQELYRDWVKRQVEGCAELKNKTMIYEAIDPDQALELTKEKNITHAVVDLDLGHGKTGLEFIEAVRNEGLDTEILIHSNRRPDVIPERVQFAPKPMISDDLAIFVAGRLPEKTKAAEQDSKEMLVYLCDDSAILARHLKKSIEKLSPVPVEVRTFENGEDLITETDKQCPDLVFTDYYMDRSGKLNGQQVIEKLALKHPALPVYLVSNLEDQDVVATILSSGAKGTLSSPPPSADLKNILQNSLQ